MLQGRRLCKISLLITLIIALSAYSPWDFLGLYDKTEAVHEYLQDGGPVSASGIVTSKEIKNGKCVYQVRKTHNHISFIFKSDSDIIPINSKVNISGSARLFSVARNEGAFDEESYYNSLDLYYEISEPQIEAVEAGWLASKDFLYRLNKALTSVFESSLPGEEAGFMSSICIGNKGNLLGELRDLFTLVGVAHILAVSGLHVSVICMAFYKLLRRVGVSYLGAGIVGGSVAVFYGLLTGGSVSSIRAIGMFLISILADVLGECYDTMTALAFMALLLLFENPLYITNGSFIFTFSAILVIYFVAIPVGKGYTAFTKRRQRCIKSDEGFGQEIKKPLRRRVEEYFVGSLIFSLCIYVGMLPIVTNMYYQTPVLSIFLNLFVLPLMPILLGIGLVAGFIGLFYLPLAQALLYICHGCIYLFEMISVVFSKIPVANVIVGHRSFVRMILYYLLLLTLIHIVRFKKLPWLCLAICIVGGTWFIPSHQAFEIDILDVGQGDGIYINSGDGVRFFIDGGSTSTDAIGKYTLLPFLKYKGAGYIDYWFVTHMDEDHVSGLMELLEAGYRIDNLVVSAEIPKDDSFKLLSVLAMENNTEILYMHQGDICGTKHLSFECIYPFNGATSEDINALSLSLLMNYEDKFSAFFGGDLGAEQEQAIASSGAIGHVNLLKVSHHGSKYSSDSSFLSTLSPDISVISCSKRNRYGHPAPEAVERLENSSESIYYTMTSGRVRIKPNEVNEYICYN